MKACKWGMEKSVVTNDGNIRFHTFGELLVGDNAKEKKRLLTIGRDLSFFLVY